MRSGPSTPTSRQKHALLAELQVEAIKTLSRSVDRSREVWDEEIEAAGLDPASATLVRLVAFGHLFVAGPELHPREFELLQVHISSRKRELTDEDTPVVVPHALALLAQLHQMIDDALEVGALLTRAEIGRPRRPADPATHPSLGRRELNGALLVSNLTSDPAWLTADDSTAGGWPSHWRRTCCSAGALPR